MKEAYIIKAYRTAVGKAPRGFFKFKRPDELAAETIEYMISQIPDFDKKLIDDLSKKVIHDFINEYEKLTSLSREALEPIIKSLINKHKTNFKGVGQPLRIALVGSRFGPGLYDVILSLDKAEVIKRLSKI